MDRETLYRRALGIPEPPSVEGHWVVYLDGGTLDLGIVRDSTLNDGNDFQIFAESFEFWAGGFEIRSGGDSA